MSSATPRRENQKRRNSQTRTPRDSLEPEIEWIALRIEAEVAAGRMTLEEAHERLLRETARRW
jgi:hypothetical protein